MMDWFLDRFALMHLRAAMVFRARAFAIGMFTGVFLFSAFLYLTAKVAPNAVAAAMWARLVEAWTFGWPVTVFLFLFYLFTTSRPSWLAPSQGEDTK